jgi:PhoPQ-activated pathogenicity-related protein
MRSPITTPSAERGLYTAYFLEMTSQQWRSPSEVDRTLWTHEVALVIPQFGLDSSDTAILLIDGGSNGGALLTEVPEAAVGAAADSDGRGDRRGSAGAQSALVFQRRSRDVERKEDAILAYSLDKALDTGDMEWAAHLAMTKAAVRAMDTVQTFAAG